MHAFGVTAEQPYRRQPSRLRGDSTVSRGEAVISLEELQRWFSEHFTNFHPGNGFVINGLRCQ